MCRKKQNKKKMQRNKAKKGEAGVELATSSLSAQGETVRIGSPLCQKLHGDKLYSYIVTYLKKI